MTLVEQLNHTAALLDSILAGPEGDIVRHAAGIIAQMPVTADGVPMYAGMGVWRINTKDAGSSWYVSGHTITETKLINDEVCCAIQPDDIPGIGWYSTTGHNRFFSTREAAEAAKAARK